MIETGCLVYGASLFGTDCLNGKIEAVEKSVVIDIGRALPLRKFLMRVGSSVEGTMVIRSAKDDGFKLSTSSDQRTWTQVSTDGAKLNDFGIVYDRVPAEIEQATATCRFLKVELAGEGPYSCNRLQVFSE